MFFTAAYNFRKFFCSPCAGFDLKTTTRYMLPRSPRTDCRTQLAYGTRDTRRMRIFYLGCCRRAADAVLLLCCCLPIVLLLLLCCTRYIFIDTNSSSFFTLLDISRFVSSLCTRYVSGPARLHTNGGRRASCDIHSLLLPLVACC